MIISVINHCHSLSDEAAQQVIRAINRQIAQDFQPYWSFGATLRLEGAIGERPSTKNLSDMRGDAVIYLVDGTNSVGASGWHTANYKDISYGLVFLGLCEQIKEPWSITLSHETLDIYESDQAALLRKRIKSKVTTGRIYRRLHPAQS